MTDDKRSNVIFLPGSLCPCSTFDSVLGMLTLNASLKCIDWTKSEVPCTFEGVASLLSEVICAAADPTILVGHSTGAALSAFTVLSGRAPVDGLVLISSGPSMRDHVPIDELITTLMQGPTDEFWESTSGSGFSVPPPMAWIEDKVRYGRSIDPKRAAEMLLNQQQTDLDDLPPCEINNVTIIHGHLDQDRHEGNAHAWLRVFPKAKIMFSPSGHFVPIEDPAIVADVISQTHESIHAKQRSKEV